MCGGKEWPMIIGKADAQGSSLAPERDSPRKLGFWGTKKSIALSLGSMWFRRRSSRIDGGVEYWMQRERFCLSGVT